jgi:hypothetical protein
MVPGQIHGAVGGMASGTTIGGPITRQQAQLQSLPQVQNERVEVNAAPVSADGNLQAANGVATAAPRSQTVTVEVSGEAPLMQAETTTLKPSPQTIGNNDAEYLSRAKPAMTPQPIPGATASGLLSIPSWSISSSGGLQRSFDVGKTWQDVDVTASAGAGVTPTQTGSSSAAEFAKAANQKKQAAAPTFRAVTAMGPEVWAGGVAGALYHSVDAGGHWMRVVPMWGGVVLSGDIVSVAFSDPQHGKITTSNASVWTTSDDGQTWQKQ